MPGAPTVKFDKTTSNYIQWCRRYPDLPASISFQILVGPLGISFNKGATSAHRIGTVSYDLPRGISECIEAIQTDYLDHKKVPSLLSSSEHERHLAGWCVRAQVGLISHRHVSLSPTVASAIRLSQFVDSLNKLQTLNGFAAEWHAFTQRVAKQISRATKGSAWCEYACQRHINNVVPHSLRFQAEIEALLKGASDRPALPSPESVFCAINNSFGKLPNPVTFPHRRSTTVDSTSRLISAGIQLYDSYPESP